MKLSAVAQISMTSGSIPDRDSISPSSPYSRLIIGGQGRTVLTSLAPLRSVLLSQGLRCGMSRPVASLQDPKSELRSSRRLTE